MRGKWVDQVLYKVVRRIQASHLSDTAGTAKRVVSVEVAISIDSNGGISMPVHGATQVGKDCKRFLPIGNDYTFVRIGLRGIEKMLCNTHICI